jgi:transposase
MCTVPVSATNRPGDELRRQVIEAMLGVAPEVHPAGLPPDVSFSDARKFSAALRLTPEQPSSGGKERLLDIGKHGDSYLRTLLIHGARAVIRTAKHKDGPLSRWVTRLVARNHSNAAGRQTPAYRLGHVEKRLRLPTGSSDVLTRRPTGIDD